MATDEELSTNNKRPLEENPVVAEEDSGKDFILNHRKEKAI
jgi:hypothetical protein